MQVPVYTRWPAKIVHRLRSGIEPIIALRHE
jgi:hypothetical protein